MRARRRRLWLAGLALLAAACGGGADGGPAGPPLLGEVGYGQGRRDGSGGPAAVDAHGDGPAAPDDAGGAGADAATPWDAGPDAAAPECTRIEDCLPRGQVCHVGQGRCVPAACEAGRRACLDLHTARVCDAFGLGYEDEPCGAGEVCEEGRCGAVVCAPGAERCEEGKLVRCSANGTAEVRAVCAGNARCIEGQCRPILSNVIVLFDTSGSMNTCVGAAPGDVAECCGDMCLEPWPVCERADQPLTRLGFSKSVFHRFFGGNATDLVRFALLSFPQEEEGGGTNCFTGSYDGLEEMSGDGGDHAAPPPPSGWFHQHRAQVVRVPFPTGWAEDNVPALLTWVDFAEEAGANPELRAMGNTPLGRSLFYAGEYVRHYVVVDGKPCAVDADCGSADYLCMGGVCTDPIPHCRQNILLVFSDGGETEHESIEDFFNPIVQARRFRYGLGCQSTADCAGEATCVGGYCDHPDIEWPTDLGVCGWTGGLCDPGEFLACGPFDVCRSTTGRFADPQGANVLRTRAGTPIQLTTHVINVAGESFESLLIAQHGGGQHFSVDVSDTELLLEILRQVVDVKLGVVCPQTP